MANSRFEYVRSFERENYLLPQTWIVIRVDGRGFHRFSSRYEFTKPNDVRALQVMNAAAEAVAVSLPDVSIAYGDSDEYSFVLDRDCDLFERRESKLVSTFVSTFTAHYIVNWPKFFPDTPLDASHLPTFDGRAVTYPSVQTLRDYLSWRQADCHINNLYNTSFWALVQQGGLSTHDAQERLKGTLASDKNEILFSQFGVNYNNEPSMFRKGTVLVREYEKAPQALEAGDTLSARQQQRRTKSKSKATVAVLHVDIIGDDFWQQRPYLTQ